MDRIVAAAAVDMRVGRVVDILEGDPVEEGTVEGTAEGTAGCRAVGRGHSPWLDCCSSPRADLDTPWPVSNE